MARAEKAGARFAVSPGGTPRLPPQRSRPGCRICPADAVSEAMALRQQGVSAVFFPADAAGGLPWLPSAAAPLPDLRFCPTGVIGEATAPAYLALTDVACVGGSWVAPRDAVAGGDWPRIERLAAAAAELKRL